MVEVKIDDNGIAVITFDDGKANALSPDMLTKLDDAITQVESEAKAIVLVGRPERFSAGFDLKLMLAGPDAANALLTQGVKFFGRLFTHPKPIVMACTGHAIAGGVLLLLCADHRVGVAGDYKLGLNETAIGMPLPVFALELAKARLDNRRLEEATLWRKSTTQKKRQRWAISTKQRRRMRWLKQQLSVHLHWLSWHLMPMR